MLLDHFHPPLSERRHWESLHHQWACVVAADLNVRLPERWFAEATVRFGIEMDVGVEDESPQAVGYEASNGGLALAPSIEPVMAIDFPFLTDEVQVQVFRGDDRPTLAASIEFVSPANKDRPSSRAAFVAKCGSYLQDALGLAIVDVVTERHANLHGELMQRFDHSHPDWQDNSLYVSAYGPTSYAEDSRLEVWFEALQLGGSLPSIPLCLKHGPRVTLDLDATYQEACRQVRIFPSNDNN